MKFSWYICSLLGLVTFILTTVFFFYLGRYTLGISGYSYLILPIPFLISSVFVVFLAKKTQLKSFLLFIALVIFSIYFASFLGIKFHLLQTYGDYSCTTNYEVSSENNIDSFDNCAIIEDKGKLEVKRIPEVQTLIKKFGEEKVSIKALEIHLAHDQSFSKQIFPDSEKEIGCVIVVETPDIGFVFQEDEELNVYHRETLQDFKNRTQNYDKKIMDKFYSSLH